MIADVLITGGRGYLGGRIARNLTGSPGLIVRIGTSFGSDNLAAQAAPLSYVRLDLASGSGLDEACSGTKTVIHLAALNEIVSGRDPEAALVVNTLGTLRLLEAAARSGVNRFIYFSTAHVYGAPLVGSIDETQPTRPVHPYAITHRAAEDFVLAYRDQKKLDGVVVRLSNGFGAPASPTADRWTLLVNDLCRQAVVDRTLVLRSSGLQTRDFICMSDVERAVVHLLSLTTEQSLDGLFNLGGLCSMSVIRMAETIQGRCRSVLGFEPTILRPDPLPGESESVLNYEIDKLESTGFRVRGDLELEIDETLLFCQTHFGSVPS